MNPWEKCTMCELRSGCEGTIVLPKVSNKEIFIVKNHPSKEEELLGVGFSDREGKLCTQLCSKYLGDIYYCTYLVKCPTDKYIKVNNIKTCGDNWFLKEVKELNPLAVMALGYSTFERIERFIERNSGSGLNFKLFLGEPMNKVLNSRASMLSFEYQLQGVRAYVETV